MARIFKVDNDNQQLISQLFGPPPQGIWGGGHVLDPTRGVIPHAALFLPPAKKNCMNPTDLEVHVSPLRLLLVGTHSENKTRYVRAQNTLQKMPNPLF